MKIVFFTNYINQHQVWLADEMYKATNGKYFFVENTPMPSFRKNLGYPDYTDRPYVIQAWKNEDEHNKAMQIGLQADIGITGTAPWEYAIARLKQEKIIFNYEERVLKRGSINAFSPEVLRSTMIAWRWPKNHYSLCASAYNARDMSLLHEFKNACFKWAYFTKVPELNIEDILRERSDGVLKIIWVARFIPLKHPEMAVQLAERLRKDRIKFVITMVGNGPLLKKYKMEVQEKGLSDCFHIIGNVPADQVMSLMRKHHIHIFTSDKNEGWGAVLNESMSSGCCPVSSHIIGSSPFLINEGKNGFMFKSECLDSLYHRISFLNTHRELLYTMGKNAYRTMSEMWSPAIAAERFISLCDNLMSGKSSPYTTGPCSPAYPYRWNEFESDKYLV